MWKSSKAHPHRTRGYTSTLLPGGQYAAGWALEDCHMQGKMFFLFIALARMVTFCKEGGGMLSVWALRARSYKTKAEA